MLDKILSQKAFLSFIFIALIIGGLYSFNSMGKLEDPEIPVKAAVVITRYPGASAEEVEQEVTDVLEKAIQRLENIDFLESRSAPGLSEITINIKSGVKTAEMPQLWDHLRRKISDVKGSLPANASEPIINDDFGDVSGIFLAISNDGYEYHEFQNYVDYVKQELMLVDGVKRIEVFGKRTEVVNISFDNEYFASLGINPMLIFQSFNDQGAIVDPGSFVTGSERIRISIGNKFQNLDEIRNFEVKLPNGGRYRLGQIAKVEREFYEPTLQKLKFNGREAISLAISMEKGGNVIVLGEAVEKRLAELQEKLPVGIECHKVFYQHNNVSESIDDFMVNLIESVIIVIVVLLLAMGMRAGLLIASGLVFTILATFIIMAGFDIELHRVSLAAIIIAMGMLVDNAIVIADGILIDLDKGMERKKAFVNTAKKSAIPLLGATLVAILAFMPLAFNSTGAGEFLRPLFYVLAISLFVSWVLAMVQTPFHAEYFYKKRSKKGADDEEHDPYGGRFYQFFGRFIRFALWHKSLFVIGTTVILVLSFWSFGFVKQNFFPGAEYDQFILEYRLPEGKDISQVEKDLDEIQVAIADWDNIGSVVTGLGSTPARYTLMRPMNGLSLSYGELIITIKDKEQIDQTIEELQTYVNQYYPEAFARVRTYIAVGGDFKIEAKFTGPDDEVLRQLAEQANEVMRQEPKAVFVTNDWKNQIKVLAPVYSQDRARELMVNRADVANALAIASSGMPVGLFYDGDYQLPVMLKLDKTIEQDVNQLASVPVWSGLPQSVALSQLVDSIDVRWENSMIRRYDNQRAIIAQCDPITGVAPPELFTALRDKIEAIPLPEGYKLEWLGEYKSSNEANEGLGEKLPLAILLMIIIVIGLFNNFRQPIIIFSIMPLAFIGVIIGFLVTGTYFTFFSIIGTLGLMGMMIKNAVVLLDEINLQVGEGKDKLTAIIDSTLSRVRPVMMASLTTILGMLPLAFDPMFRTMAIAIMFGLLVGSIITLVVIPVLYAVMYRVNTKSLHATIVKEIEE
ncbi:efflux RND transporter permease subunit [Carboxylicivirga mesophila]|uniref:Efflux RND transporter permease subunit n=1 Tax=Carboxylicivirga mesophila TaxID=1166478 RepID=A0ABS5KBC8_9BACT|nr:efflux RND transporter permease subunit [Carboxylicivirga mesophila]MBS2212286.1 efflux RND transporter permease subunit [Carboxylicivirga mesophila]